jgi:hypothetical protein
VQKVVDLKQALQPFAVLREAPVILLRRRRHLGSLAGEIFGEN